MSIKKSYAKNKPTCKVTFRLDGQIADSAKNAFVVGEFNNWSTTATPMKRLKNGDFTATLDMESGREYQFRYLLAENHWENDPQADKEVDTPYGDSRNSVIIL